MLSQIKNKKKEKKAMSALVGYVLLVSFVILMGTIIYNVLETYVPKDLPECPEGVSVFVKEISCTENVDKTFELSLTLKNNGRFDVGGYFIYATNESNQTLATWNISNYLESGGSQTGETIGFFNPYLEPSKEIKSIFMLPQEIFSVEITPVRFEPFISCGEAKIKMNVDCSFEGGVECINSDTRPCSNQEGVCVDSFQTCTGNSWPGCDYSGITGYEAGTEINCEDGLDNDCDGYTDNLDADCGGTCANGDTQPCSLQDGVCVDSFQTCTGNSWPGCDYSGITGYEAGTEINCEDGLDNDCDGKVDGVDEDCIPPTYCGDGAIQTPNGAGFNEKCDDGNTDNGDGCSAICTIETGWSCDGEPSECSSCNGAWNLPENVECDGGDNCLVGCICAENYIPDGSGGCEPCNGDDTCDAGEGCLCLACEGERGDCDEGLMCVGEECVTGVPDTVTGCNDYCASYLLDYTDGICRQNSAQCTVNGETWEAGGDVYCSAGLTDTCCCVP